MELIQVNGWVDSKNEFVLFSFCERQFSTLTSYWCTTWVDNMNANKIRKKKHQYEQIEAGGFGRRIKLDLTGYVNKGTRGKRKEIQRERRRRTFCTLVAEKDRIHHRKSQVIEELVHWCTTGEVPFLEVAMASEEHLLRGKTLRTLCMRLRADI